MTREELCKLNLFQLRVIARDVGIESPTTLNKEALCKAIVDITDSKVDKSPNKFKRRGRPPIPLKSEQPIIGINTPVLSSNAQVADTTQEFQPNADLINPENLDDCVVKEGILDIHSDGYGFIRTKNCENSDNDAYLSAQKIKKSGLRKGDYVKALTKSFQDNKVGAVINLLEVNGTPFEQFALRPNFDELVPIYPEEKLHLEISNNRNDLAIRSIDLVAPIGKGQRAMIVSPPKAGKTTLLKKIANSITANHSDVKLFVLLIDERPEEVTDMQRSIKGEVIYSTFDETPEHHTRAAELLLARCKRLVEMGRDVVILMDSLTRLARAYNLTIPPTGRTLSGGIDPGALHNPKRFFGSARNIEKGGSLTIIATALIDTGSKMDDVIYEEFKGTGNMEIHLDRRLSEKRIFPAIDLFRSGTRREELLLTQKELEGIWGIRKMLSSGDTQEAAENIIGMMLKSKNNDEMIDMLKHQINIMQKGNYRIK